ncbi:hypothetical protein [Rothia nasimurium]|nr:hypothetical protein [Rothia nasimurium]
MAKNAAELLLELFDKWFAENGGISKSNAEDQRLMDGSMNRVWRLNT